jgi:hypothetical protein
MTANRVTGPLLKVALKRCFGAPFGVGSEFSCRHDKSRYKSRSLWRGLGGVPVHDLRPGEPAARGAASHRPEAGRGARCDGERSPRGRLIPAVASSGPPGLRLPRSLPPASVRGAGERLRHDEDGEHEKAGATPSAVGQRLLLYQGTRVHQPRMCPDNFMLPVMPAARARMWPSCMATHPSILVLRQDPSVFEACAAAPVGNSLYAHTSGLVPDGRFLTSGNGDLSWFR